MDSTFCGSLRHQLRGIVRKGGVRVKARASVKHHCIVLRTGGQNHSFLSLQIESGFGAILSFLSELSQVLCSGGRRVTPSARAQFLRRRESYSLRSGIFPQSPQDQPGDWRSSVGLVVMDVKTDMLSLVVVDVQKNIANKSAACSAIGHFGQEVSKIELSPDEGDK